MPTPKKKSSRMRKGHRRSHDHISEVATSICPNCNNLIRPHHMCAACGTYKGREIVAARV